MYQRVEAYPRWVPASMLIHTLARTPNCHPHAAWLTLESETDTRARAETMRRRAADQPAAKTSSRPRCNEPNRPTTITVAVRALRALGDNEPNSVPRENDHRAAPGIAGDTPRWGRSGSNIRAIHHAVAPVRPAPGAAAPAPHRNCANSALRWCDDNAAPDPPIAKRLPG